MHITPPNSSPQGAVSADPLAELEKAFKHWRDNKKSAREHIPSDLLEAALNLSKHYGSTEVRRRLGISNAQLKRLEASSQNKPVDFIAVSQHAVAESAVAKPVLRVEIHTAEGATITLSGLPETEPLAMIAKLIGGKM